jgi:hypothetical protein
MNCVQALEGRCLRLPQNHQGGFGFLRAGNRMLSSKAE